MIKDIIKNKAKTYQEIIPRIYNAIQYESGMEDGWIVIFDIGSYMKFKTVTEAINWFEVNQNSKSCEIPKPFIYDGRIDNGINTCCLIENSNDWILWDDNEMLSVLDDKTFQEKFKVA